LFEHGMTCRYLVTGAQGFVGRYFVAYLLDRFPHSKVLGIGRSPCESSTFLHSVTCGARGVRAPLPERLRNMGDDRYAYASSELSSRKLTELICEFHPTAVVHLAASLRGISEEIVFQNNVRGTEGLLAAVRASGVNVRLLLVASSGGVYGRQESLPIAESASVQPVDLYSRSKLASEDLARSFALQTGIPTAIARIFNVFGPGQDELHFAGRMAGQVAAILAGKSAPIIRAGLLSGTRDFLDVRDVCSALGAVLERNLDGVCNIAAGVETKVGDLLQLLVQTAGLQSTVQIQQQTHRPDPIPRHFANISRLAETGFAPQHSHAQTWGEMLNYYTRMIYAEHHP
jgi:GDP-4-dehydro-6-deoxy-D-mannose reductase